MSATHAGFAGVCFQCSGITSTDLLQRTSGSFWADLPDWGTTMGLETALTAMPSPHAGIDDVAVQGPSTATLTWGAQASVAGVVITTCGSERTT